MARFLDKLSQQPKPLLYRMNLDKQPEAPLLQRVFSRLPKRRPGERYAFGPTPHAFLAYQPQRPLLSGISLWSHPLVTASTWLEQPPLARLAGSQNSLLGDMDSLRVPGLVTSVLLLGLSLVYLLNLSAGTPEGSTTVAEEKTPEEAAEEAVLAAMALTPEEEAEIAKLAAAAEAVDAEGSAPAETVAAEEAMAESLGVAPPGQTVPADETEAGAAMLTSGESSETRAEPEAADNPPAEAEPAPEPVQAVEPEPEPEPAPAPVKAEAGSEPAAAASKPAAEPVSAPRPKAAKPAPRAPEEPVYFTEQRSLAILTEARYLYLSGEGKVAAEKLGLALSAGYIKDEFAPAFTRMESEIRNLLDLYEAAQDGDTVAVQAFLDAEEAVFPGQVSFFEAQLPAPEAGEPAAAEPATPPVGLQAPDSEPADGEAASETGADETRPH